MTDGLYLCAGPAICPQCQQSVISIARVKTRDSSGCPDIEQGRIVICSKGHESVAPLLSAALDRRRV